MANTFAGLPGPGAFQKKPAAGGGGALRDLAGRIADEQGVPRDLFFALIDQESGWNLRAVSPKGARGLTQLMPATARSLGVKDPLDPEQNLRGGARYLAVQLKRFKGDVEKALAAYNAGPGAVVKYKGIPPFRETRNYVARIMKSVGGVSTADLDRRQQFLEGGARLASRGAGAGAGSFAGLPGPDAFAGLPSPEELKGRKKPSTTKGAQPSTTPLPYYISAPGRAAAGPPDFVETPQDIRVPPTTQAKRPPQTSAPSPHGRAGAALGVSPDLPTGELPPGQPVRPQRAPGAFDQAAIFLGKLGDVIRAGGAQLGAEIDKNPALGLTLLRGAAGGIGTFDISDEALKKGEAIVRSGQAGIAAGRDLSRNYPPAFFTNAAGLKPGDPGYMGARVLDYALDFSYNPGDIIAGKEVGRAVVGTGKAAARPLGTAAAKARAKLAQTRPVVAAKAKVGAALSGVRTLGQEPPLRALAERYALSDTGKFASKGKAHLSAADAARLQAAAKAAGVSPDDVAREGNKIVRNANRELTKKGLPLTGPERQAFVQARLERQSIPGRVAGAARSATAALPPAAKVSLKGISSAAKELTAGVKQGLLSRPSTVFTNAIVSPPVQAADEMARHGIGLAGAGAQWVKTAKPARAELIRYKKTGEASGDIAELLEHAPGLLDDPATLAGATQGPISQITAKWNPFLLAQGYGDQLAKVQLYKILKPKLGAEEAAKRVSTAMFNYNALPKTLRRLDQHGLLIFGSFLGASTKSLASQLAARPDLVARYARLQQQMFEEHPGSREDFKKLPGWQRTRFVYPLGNGYFLDLQRFHQWAPHLTLLQDIADHGMPLARLGLTELLEKTPAGPGMGAVLTEKRTFPMEAEGMSPGFADALKRYLPIARDIERVAAAVQGRPMGTRETDEAQALGVALLQAVLGASIVRAESEPEKKRRLREPIRERKLTVRDFILDLRQRVGEGATKNRFAGTFGRLQTADDAKRVYTAAGAHYTQQKNNPQNAPGGRLTEAGRKRIEEAYLRMTALRDRFRELKEAERGR